MGICAAVFLLLLGLKLGHVNDLPWVTVFIPVMIEVFIDGLALGLVAALGHQTRKAFRRSRAWPK